jgi:3-deoxy-manno-octulosonate cytidylyltransferase (CMP-KDO synthetase)
LKPALGIIPVRYGSKRFPGKPLAPIRGKPMVQWVFENARRATRLDRLIVATDDERILKTALDFGAEACLTSPDHASGTERVSEAAEAHDHPIVINIQGDEPLLEPGAVDLLIEALQDGAVAMATLAARSRDLSRLKDPHTVKVVTDSAGYALYFSRSAVPHGATDWFWEHIGIYGYQKEFLHRFPRLEKTRLERTEGLEQLRALEHGFRIKVLPTEYSTLSVDTPADIIRVERKLGEGFHAD